MKKGHVIAIDGPSGAGKSTVARTLAKRLGYRYIDTGAMYRAAALYAHRLGVDIHDQEKMAEMLEGLSISQDMRDGEVRTYLSGEDVSQEIRRPEMAMKASDISALPEVRKRLLELQREMGRQGGVVLEGRDIGTVVFPDADHKFFLTASAEERARRRYAEHMEKGEVVDETAVLEEIEKRDLNDSMRAVAPLKKADDATEIDSTGKDVEGVVSEMMSVFGGSSGGR